jgi:hypothetical protein
MIQTVVPGVNAAKYCYDTGLSFGDIMAAGESLFR